MEEFWVKDVQNCSGDIWRFRGDIQIPIFSVAKPLRDLLLPCYQRKFGVEEVHIGIIWSLFLGECSCPIFPWKKKIKNQSVAEIVWNIRAKRENCIDSRSHHFHREGEEGLVLVDCRGHWTPSLCQCQENLHAVDHMGIVAHTRDHCKGRSSANSRWNVCGGEWTPGSQRSCSWRKSQCLGHLLCHYWVWALQSFPCCSPAHLSNFREDRNNTVSDKGRVEE